MSIEINNFGLTPSGNLAHLFTISNKKGMSAKLTDFGAVLVSLFVPDKNGQIDDVVLGFDNLEKYLTNDCCYFGSTIGRNSNRIKNSEFVLNNKTYYLNRNEKGNNLHSGDNCYNKRLWNYKINENNSSVCFSLISPDGDQGFPGEFKVNVIYTLTDDNSLKIEYNGICDKDTVVNMTNHSYFNLSGHASGSIEEHTLYINSDTYVPVDSELIPTGILQDVSNTPMDFRNSKKISLDINSDFEQLKFTNGYDHSFVINKFSDGIEKIAILSDENSGRTMEVYSDSIGVQFYAGNFIENNKIVGKENCLYKNRNGLCLETGFLPNSINESTFKSPILKAGEKYNTTTIYKFL